MGDREPIDHSAENLVATAASLFGIDLSQRANLRGIPSYALKGRVQGTESKYKATFEHGPTGDLFTAYAYPLDMSEARNRLTTIILLTHPLRDTEAKFADFASGQAPELLEGYAAQQRIATFLEEAQADISQRTS